MRIRCYFDRSLHKSYIPLFSLRLISMILTGNLPGIIFPIEFVVYNLYNPSYNWIVIVAQNCYRISESSVQWPLWPLGFTLSFSICVKLTSRPCQILAQLARNPPKVLPRHPQSCHMVRITVWWSIPELWWSTQEVSGRWTRSCEGQRWKRSPGMITLPCCWFIQHHGVWPMLYSLTPKSSMTCRDLEDLMIFGPGP